MSVKYEKINQTKVSGKGILKGIDSSGITIQDVKEGNIDVISFGDIESLLLEKEVNFSFGCKEIDEE